MQTHNFTPRHARGMGGGWSVFRGRNVLTLRPAPCGINYKVTPMKHDQFYSGQTQVFWVCEALLDGRTISQETEIREVRGWRLGAIIHRLKADYAWPICAAYRHPDNVAFYFCHRTQTAQRFASLHLQRHWAKWRCAYEPFTHYATDAPLWHLRIPSPHV